MLKRRRIGALHQVANNATTSPESASLLATVEQLARYGIKKQAIVELGDDAVEKRGENMSERPSICTFINGERAKILSAGQGRAARAAN